MIKKIICWWSFAIIVFILHFDINAKEGTVQCANLIYAVSKTSKCFSDEFLRETERVSNIHTERKFQSVKLASEEVFKYPFIIMTGEGNFIFSSEEKENLKFYLSNGGFLLASAGCSSKEWNDSFKKSIKEIFPSKEFVKIPLSHPVFKTIYKIDAVSLKHPGGDNNLYGLEHNGKIVAIFSPQGLNDTAHTENCCCCGGNEISNSLSLMINILAYSLLY